MSESVIRAKAMCCEVHGLYRSGVSNCPMCKPPYGPDALVRAVAEVFQSCNVVGLNGEAVTPKDIVDRLASSLREPSHA